MKIAPSKTRRINIVPSKTRKIDAELIAKALGAEHVARVSEKEGMKLYLQRQAQLRKR